MGYGPILIATKARGYAETELALRNLLAAAQQLRDLIAV